MTNVEQYKTDPLMQMEVDASLISDDEGSDWDEHEQMEMDTDSDAITQNESMPADDDPSPQSFNLNGLTTSDMEDAPNVIIDEEDCIAETATAELLCRHYDMGHISFTKLQQMARQ